MAGSTVKLGVDVTEFKRGMTEAQSSIKTLDATIKTNEKSMQLYGKSESYVSTQAALLNSKLKEQEKIVQNAEKSLKAMDENGISPTSKAYQEMTRKMVEARGAMIDTTMEINNLATEEQEAAKDADQLATSVSNIGKKMSVDQVISGLDSIKSALESAAKKAVDFGKAIWDNVTSSADWADSTATAAMILGMDVEEYQRYTKVFDTMADITVKDWQNAKNKVQKAVTKPTDDQYAMFAALGVGLRDVNGTIDPRYNRYVIGAARDWEDVFWDVGAKLRENVKNGKMTQDEADVYAQALFGKSWANLNPIFEQGKDAFEQALLDQEVVTEESINKLADLNDALVKLQGDFGTLKSEILSGLAPALQQGAEALDGVLSSIIEYLQTPGGQEALQKLGDAVSGLFADLGKIDPEKVVEGFVDVFTKVTGGIQWLVDNQETAKGILAAIVTGWGAITIGENVLKVFKFIDGIKGLTGTAAAEGAAAGASWGTAFADAVMKVAPWLVGLYTMLNPAGSQDDASFNSEGKLTNEGYYSFIEQSAGNADYKSFLMELGTYFGGNGLRDLLNNGDAVSDIYNYLISGKAGSNTLGFVNNTLGKYTGQQFGTEWLGVQFNEEELNEILQGIQPAITPQIILPDDTAQQISQDIGVVPVAVQPVFHRNRMTGDWMGEAPDGSEANGIWAVPYDGFLARLHKNERVVPAREVASHNFSSNLYVESMYMSGGADAEGLAASMAAAQRRTMAGYGS